MNELQLYTTLIAFMQRVQLQGAEVPAFAACMQYLTEARDRLSQPILESDPE